MLICLEMMHDIFDELMVTTIVEVHFNKDVMILNVYAAVKLNRLTSYFVACICECMKFCC